MGQPDFRTHYTTKQDWTDIPLHILLYEWSAHNMYIPTDVGTLMAYIGFFLITWYTIVWLVRMLMTIIWPLFIISSAIVVFRIMQFYEPEDIKNIMSKSFTVVADTLVYFPNVAAVAKSVEFALSFVE